MKLVSEIIGVVILAMAIAGIEVGAVVFVGHTLTLSLWHFGINEEPAAYAAYIGAMVIVATAQIVAWSYWELSRGG